MDGYNLRTVSTLEATEPRKSGNTGRIELGFPASMVATPFGKLYVLDRNAGMTYTVEKGELVKLAGSSTGMRNGPADTALFQHPTNLCLSPTNGVLVADSGNHAIRLIHEGEVTTFAGGNGLGRANGKSAIAQFSFPNALALNPTNFDLYVADSGNNLIRVISSTIVSDFAGIGEAGKVDGPALEYAKFRAPEGLLVTSTGDVLVADTKNHLIRLISDGIVTTLAGDGTERFGDGPNAKFSSPTSMCFSPQGDLVIVDSGNNRIRMLSNGVVSTIAGNGQIAFKDGAVGKSSFNYPTAAVWTRAGHLLIADGHNHRIRVIEDETHVLAPDMAIVVDLHEKPEKFSIAVGDFDISLGGRNWHLNRCILQQRCPALLVDSNRERAEKLKISLRGAKVFCNFIYRDVLPEGQFGPTYDNIKDWIELDALALVAQLDRLASFARWRVWYLLNLCDSIATFRRVIDLTLNAIPEFEDTLLEILSSIKTKPAFGLAFAEIEKSFPAPIFAKLTARANMPAHPIPRPTTSPLGLLSPVMEPLCPAKSSATAVEGLLQLTAEGESFNVHPVVAVSRWPLIFKWFFTKSSGESNYVFPSKTSPGGLTASALHGLLRYFYTGKLDGLKSSADCKLIADNATELSLTTESCANLLTYCWQREAELSQGKGDGKGDKCIVM